MEGAVLQKHIEKELEGQGAVFRVATQARQQEAFPLPNFRPPQATVEHLQGSGFACFLRALLFLTVSAESSQTYLISNHKAVHFANAFLGLPQMKTTFASLL